MREAAATARAEIRVLIVDDSVVVRRVLKNLLETGSRHPRHRDGGRRRGSGRADGAAAARRRDDGSRHAGHGRPRGHGADHGALPDARAVLQLVLRPRRHALAVRRARRRSARRRGEAHGDARRSMDGAGRRARPEGEGAGAGAGRRPHPRRARAGAAAAPPRPPGPPDRRHVGGRRRDRRLVGRPARPGRVAVVAAAGADVVRHHRPAHGGGFPRRADRVAPTTVSRAREGRRRGGSDPAAPRALRARRRST